MKNVFDYQMVVVFDPKAEEKNKEKVLVKLETMLSSAGAKVASKKQLGMKELVYPIKKQSKGEFWIVAIKAAKPVKLSEINVFLNRETEVIRYLVLKE